MAETNYETIDRPYNDYMQRSAPSEVPTAADTGGDSIDMLQPVKAGGALNDVQIKTTIKSDNYEPGKGGFILNGATGTIECMNLISTRGTIGGWQLNTHSITDTTDTFGLDSTVTAGDDVRLYAGASNANRATAPFIITESGVITATSGTIGGWTLGLTSLSSAGLILDSANSLIKSTSYSAGSKGFKIDETIAEFNNIISRGLIKTANFQKGTVSAIGGHMMLSTGSDTLATDMTELDSATLTTKGTETFAVSDILRIKEGVNDEWLTVTNIASAPTYTVARDAAGVYTSNANPAWKAGVTVVNYGASGKGFVEMAASETNSPWLKVKTHAGSPWSTISDKLVIGQLKDVTGIDEFGIWTDNGYFTGTINAGAGTIGGFTIAADNIKDNNDSFGLSSVETGTVVTSQGPSLPGTVTNNAAYGAVAWTNFNNIKLDDNTYATAIFTPGQISNYLVASNFGFTVPSEKLITGIEVTVKRHAANAIDRLVYDDTIQLMKAGILVGLRDEIFVERIWSDVDETVTYGSSTNLWGAQFKASDINDAGFGVSFACWGDTLTTTTAYVDYIKVKVHFYEPVSSDVRFWAGSAFANRGTAPFRVTEDGDVFMESATIAGYKTYDAIVDIEGDGDYTDIKSAIDDGNSNLFVKKGIYQVADMIRFSGNTQLTGEDCTSTVLTRKTGTDVSMLGGEIGIGGASTEWMVTVNGNISRYTWTGKGRTAKFNRIKRGQIIYITDATYHSSTGWPTNIGFSAVNQGGFILSSVGSNYFEVYNTTAVPELVLGGSPGLYRGGPGTDSCVIVYSTSLIESSTSFPGAHGTVAITNVGTNLWRYTVAPPVDAHFDELMTVGSVVKIHEYDLISSGNAGMFTLLTVANNYFEVYNTRGLAESGKRLYSTQSYIEYVRYGDDTTCINFNKVPDSKYLSRVRVSWDGTGTNPFIISPVIGSEISIYSPLFDTGNNGDFIVQDIGTNYIEISNSNCVDRNHQNVSAAGWIRNGFEALGTSGTEIAVTNPTGNTWRYTWTTVGANPAFNINLVVGMEVKIPTDSTGFSSNNSGNFRVTAVTGYYFEIKKDVGTVQTKSMGYNPIKRYKNFGIYSTGESTISSLSFVNISTRNYAAVYNAANIVNCVFDESSAQFGYQVSRCSNIKDSYFSTPYSGDCAAINDPASSTTIKNNYFESMWATNVITNKLSWRIGDSTTTTTITRPGGIVSRYTWTGVGTNPYYTNLMNDNYIEVNSETMSDLNKGLFKIVAHGTDYFDVNNIQGVAEANKTNGVGYIIDVGYNLVSDIDISDNFFWVNDASPGNNNSIDLTMIGSIFCNNSMYVQIGYPGWTFLNMTGLNNQITNNYFQGLSDAIVFADSGFSTISGNSFEDCTTSIRIRRPIHEAIDGGCVITGNTFKRPDGYGSGIIMDTSGYFYLTNINYRITISSNTFNGIGNTIDANYARGMIITGNSMANGTGAAIGLYSGSYCVISGNNMNNMFLGIGMNASSYCTITGNLSYSNTTPDEFVGTTGNVMAGNI